MLYNTKYRTLQQYFSTAGQRTGPSPRRFTPVQETFTTNCLFFLKTVWKSLSQRQGNRLVRMNNNHTDYLQSPQFLLLHIFNIYLWHSIYVSFFKYRRNFLMIICVLIKMLYCLFNYLIHSYAYRILKVRNKIYVFYRSAVAYSLGSETLT